MTSRPRIRIAMAGLDGSGKTTLLEQWKARYESSLPPVPLDRIRPTTGSLRSQSLGWTWKCMMWRMRNLWQSYSLESDALLFVVDASNVDRLEEARGALAELIHDGALDEHVAVVVVANKHDMDGALSTASIRNAVVDPAAAEARAASVEFVSAPEPGTPSMRPVPGAWQGGALAMPTAVADAGAAGPGVGEDDGTEGEAAAAGKGGKQSPLARGDARGSPTRVVEASGFRGEGLDVLEWLVRRVGDARRRAAR